MNNEPLKVPNFNLGIRLPYLQKQSLWERQLFLFAKVQKAVSFVKSFW
jgi:hypothetical protein